MKHAFRKDDALLADIAGAPRSEYVFRVWWLGQSGFLIAWNGRHLLLDPYLSDSLTRKYEGSDKPHQRVTELVIDPSRLGCVDAVTSSHHHTDHLDGETLTALRSANPRIAIVVPAAHRALAAERAGVDPSELLVARVGRPIVLRSGFELHAVAAAHEEIEIDGDGHHRFVGYVARFGGFSIYHSGDTILYDGIVETLAPFGVDVAILPINGRRPERRVAGNLWGREAAQLAKDIGATLAVPCHYDLFAFNTEPPAEFEAACRELDQAFRTLENGEGFDYQRA